VTRPINTRSDADATVWTTRKLQAWMNEAFTKKNLDSPRLLAEMLLAHVIGCERLRLYMDQDRPATPLERNTLRDLVSRALNHEPVQYLTGEAWFFGMPFHVDPRVLIPRPSTETIVEHLLQHARTQPGFGGAGIAAPVGGGGAVDIRGEGILIADLCTGSGCITIAVLKHLPGARAVATDISTDALDVARKNAERHGVADRIDFVHGDLLAALDEFPVTRGKGSLHYLVSNPPYIPDDEWPAVEPNVRDHEPHLALRGGVDGLDFIRTLIESGPRFLRAAGLMLLELPDSRAELALGIAQTTKELRDARIVKDIDGLRRVLIAQRVAESR
jgi:release factor glutamine methyltransferase